MQGEDWRGTPRRAAISSGQGRPDRSSAGESESESERSSSSASVEGRDMARNKGLKFFFSRCWLAKFIGVEQVVQDAG